MQISPIYTDTDYEAALARIEQLWDAPPGTPGHDEIEVLSVLVSAYEDLRWPAPAPIEAMRFHMEQNGLRPKDLGAVLGSDSRASEILHGRRPMTVEMIRALHEQWGIPLASLIGKSTKPHAA